MNNQEIIDKTLKIRDYILNTESYKNYLKAKKNLENNKDIQKLIKEIKTMQQELVKNISKKDEIERLLDKKLNILYQDPCYLEYQIYQDEVNNLLTILENKINKYFFDVFN